MNSSAVQKTRRPLVARTRRNYFLAVERTKSSTEKSVKKQPIEGFQKENNMSDMQSGLVKRVHSNDTKFIHLEITPGELAKNPPSEGFGVLDPEVRGASAHSAVPVESSNYYRWIFDWIASPSSTSLYSKPPEVLPSSDSDDLLTKPDPVQFDFEEYRKRSKKLRGVTLPFYNNKKMLKVSNTILFTPWNCFDDNYFQGAIYIKNTSRVNLTYEVLPSELSKFQVIDPVGWIGPKARKQIIITSNPKHDYSFEDLKNGYFQVFAYPVMFKSQLDKYKIQTFWDAFHNSLFPKSILEIHTVDKVYPGSQELWDNYSLLDTLQFCFKTNQGPIIIESFEHDKINLNDFLSCWNCESADTEEMLMRFKVEQLKKEIVSFTERDSYKQRVKVFLALSMFIGIGVAMSVYTNTVDNGWLSFRSNIGLNTGLTSGEQDNMEKDGDASHGWFDWFQCFGEEFLPYIVHLLL